MYRLLFAVRVVLPLCATILGAVLVPQSSHAQNAIRSRVVVALVEALPEPAENADVALVIRALKGQPDVILLPASADGRSLASATFTLLIARQTEPTSVTRAHSLRVPNHAVPTAWRTGEVDRAHQWVKRLQLAPPREISGVGMVRSIDLYLSNRPIAKMTSRSRP